MRYKFVDAHGFAGGFACGAVQSGMQLVGKRETSPFGVAMMETNRHILGEAWETQVEPDYDAWEPALDADVVLGNPPCSGFSLMTHKDHRGVDASVNACMKGFVKFAARHPNAQIAVFESVQQAYTQGGDFMRLLREGIEWYSGQRWDLFHVLHNGYSIGGSSIRRRYFWVASRIPFGIDPPTPKRVPVLQDVIGDLEGLSLTWNAQPYRRQPSWWVIEQNARNGAAAVDGHKNVANTTVLRNFDLITEDNPWPIKATTSQVARSYYERYGRLPDSWSHLEQKIISKRDPKTGEFRMGFIQPSRWHPERACRVITGAGLMTSIHPHEDRMLTHREVARIMGFPDNWFIYPIRNERQLAFNWGKGILTQCGKWISEWIQTALDGNPSDHRGEQIGEREWLHNSTYAYRPLSMER